MRRNRRSRLLAAEILVAWTLALASPLLATAQHTRAQVGVLWLGYGPDVPRVLERELRNLGWQSGKNMELVPRYAENKPERLPALAAELVRLRVDVLVAVTSSTAFIARNATATIPIVVYAAHGGVETGLFASLSRPGGNVTGTESLAPQLDAKRLELLRQLAPSASQVAIVFNPDNPGAQLHLNSTREAAQALGMAVIPTPVRGPQDFDSAFSALDSKTHDGLLIFTDEVTDLMPIASYQTHRRLPSVCEFGYQAEYFGCLASYGPLLSELWVATAQQVDRVLKGAKPAELPVQQMTHYELVINKKIARDMGMTVPPSILIRADRLIE